MSEIRLPIPRVVLELYAPDSEEIRAEPVLLVSRFSRPELLELQEAIASESAKRSHDEGAAGIDGLPCGPANANLSELDEARVGEVERNVRGAVAELLDALLIDWRNDHNSKDTPRRVARMLVREVCAGRYRPAPKATTFPNAEKLDELYTVGPITVRSLCAHHLVPVLGQAWIGVIPGERLMGLSKFARLTEWVMARPQMQEEAAVQLADLLENRMRPRGLAVSIRAQHHCLLWRGVRESDTSMTTNVMRGVFRDDRAAREEFLGGIR